MPSPPLTPFDMLLCQRGPEEELDWARGFATAEHWERHNPCLAETLAGIVAAAGDWSGHLPYDAFHEGLVHGLYGLAEYRRWKESSMRLVTRAEWGARPPKQRQLLARNQQRGTAVHYSAADADEQADHANCAKRVRGIQDFHMDGRGWSDIAYSYLCCKHGYVYEGRGRGIRTAAQGTNDGNDAYHAVCFLGDDTAGRDDVTATGRQAMADAIHWCNAWADVSEVRPHSSFHSTSCPGDDLRAWITRGLPAAPEEEQDMPLSDDDLDKIVAAVRKALTTPTGLTAQGGSPMSKINDIQGGVDRIEPLTVAVGVRLAAVEDVLVAPPEPPA